MNKLNAFQYTGTLQNNVCFDGEKYRFSMSNTYYERNSDGDVEEKIRVFHFISDKKPSKKPGDNMSVVAKFDGNSDKVFDVIEFVESKQGNKNMKLTENTNESALKEFKDGLEEWIRADSGVSEEVIEILADRQLEGCWDVRTWFHEPHMLALNVKGKGGGNWDSFNRGGRAEAQEVSEDYYWNVMQQNIQVFYNGLNNSANDELGISVYSGGRSGGWWGFKIDDINNDFTDILEWNDEAVRTAFEKGAPTLFGETDEVDFFEEGEDYASGLEQEEVANLLRFTNKFVNFCNTMEGDIQATSDYWETDESNDEEFSYHFGESKAKVQESLNGMDIQVQKQKINDLCQWAIDSMEGDRDALFFGVGHDGILVKGKMLDYVYMDMYNHDEDHMADAFESMVADYNAETGNNLQCRILGHGSHQIEVRVEE